MCWQKALSSAIATWIVLTRLCEHLQVGLVCFPQILPFPQHTELKKKQTNKFNTPTVIFYK